MGSWQTRNMCWAETSSCFDRLSMRDNSLPYTAVIPGERFGTRTRTHFEPYAITSLNPYTEYNLIQRERVKVGPGSAAHY